MPNVTDTPLPQKLTSAEVAAHFRVSLRTVQNWRDQYGLPYLRLNRRVIRYDRDELMAWQRK
jgi:excisionase family DNA binding protein